MWLKKNTKKLSEVSELFFYTETGKLRFHLGSDHVKLSVAAAQAGGASKHSLNQFYY